MGPACYKYVKAGTAFEGKMQNQVCQNVLVISCIDHLIVVVVIVCFARYLATKAKRVSCKREFISGRLSAGSASLRESPGLQLTKR